MSLPFKRGLIQRRRHTCSEISGDVVPGFVGRPSMPLPRAHCRDTRDRDDGNAGRLSTGFDPWSSEPTQSHECAWSIRTREDIDGTGRRYQSCNSRAIPVEVRQRQYYTVYPVLGTTIEAVTTSKACRTYVGNRPDAHQKLVTVWSVSSRSAA